MAASRQPLARALPSLAARFGLVALTALAGCSSATSYLLPPAPAVQQVRSPVRGIALADVSLPSYASDVEIAALVGFIASEPAGFLTGSNLSMNGGQHMR